MAGKTTMIPLVQGDLECLVPLRRAEWLLTKGWEVKPGCAYESDGGRIVARRQRREDRKQS